MKNHLFISILLSLAIYLTSNVSIGQTYSLEIKKDIPIDLTQIAQKNPQTTNLLTNSLEDNTVFINQVGENNQVNSYTNASTSSIQVLQNGNQNKVYLDISADTIDELVIQNGNNNTLLDYSTFGVESHELQLIQNGNNQNLIWYGGNSISEKMKITMQGESKTIIVRNFN